MSMPTPLTIPHSSLRAAPPDSGHDQSVMTRGDVFCSQGFRARSAAWFTLQKEKQKKPKQQPEQGAVSVGNDVDTKPRTKSGRRAYSTAPTRIQPARAAKSKSKKRKVDDCDDAADEAASSARKKQRTEQADASSLPMENYVLDPAFAHMSVHNFEEAIDTLLEGRRQDLAHNCFWSTVMAKTRPREPASTSSAPYTDHWCPIVAAPLACSDKEYCLHAMSLSDSKAETLPAAPEADMTPSRTPLLSFPELPVSPIASVPSLPTEQTEPASSPTVSHPPPPQPFAEQQHVEARAVEFAGLRFAVDMCNGMLRVLLL